MSKNNQKKFDYKSLDINREINEEIGKLKNRISYTYGRMQKNNSKNKINIQQDKSKRNKVGNKKSSNSSLEGLKEQKNQGTRKNSNNHYQYQYSRDSKDNEIKSLKSKEGINILRAKVIKKKNFDKVERVVIDLVNHYEIDPDKTESVSNSNAYENEKYDKKSNEYYDNLNNIDNNIYNNNSNSNDIAIAINMIESRWKNNCTSINVLNMPVICDEITRKKKEIEIILNRWDNNVGITKDKLSIFNDNNNYNNNIINKWKKNQKISKELDLDFPVDVLKIKEKENNNNINRWITNNQKINGQNLSFLVDIEENNKKEIEKIKERWNNNSQPILEDNISFIVDQIKLRGKKMDNDKNRWNNNCQEIKNESISYMVDIMKIKQKELESIINRWNNNIEKENIFSIESKKDKDSFNYSKKKYIENLLKNIYISENNNNNYIVLNHENNINNNLNKLNYKIIKPNNKSELELALINIYNENNNNHEKTDDLNNNSNSITDIVSTKETFINPLFVLNDEQLTQLYEEFNNKIGKKNTGASTKYSISKEIELDYGIIDPYSPSVKNNYYSLNIEKINDVNVNGEKKKGEDFEQNTPLSLLNDKFYVYAVSRNNKYSILSPQPSVNYIYNDNSKINLAIKDKLRINHFSLRIEKIDKGESYRSSELNEASDKK